jgi:cephalosporin hydroxylase
MPSSRLSTGCSLPKRVLEEIQSGTLKYTYKNVLMHKNPFDLAIYQLLLWEQKPKTLFEIGSLRGGSALWFADTLRNFGIDCHIISIDLQPPSSLDIPGVRFVKGDAQNLSGTLTDDWMNGLSRPFFVVEDADHRAATTLAVLRFFDRWLRLGEYVIVEDGIVDDLYDRKQLAQLQGGPRRGVADFLRDRGDAYEIDTRLCDFYGTNVTWNVNGFLKRTK